MSDEKILTMLRGHAEEYPELMEAADLIERLTAALLMLAEDSDSIYGAHEYGPEDRAPFDLLVELGYMEKDPAFDFTDKPWPVVPSPGG